MASEVKDVKYDKKMYYIITFIQCVMISNHVYNGEFSKLKTRLLAIPNKIKLLNFEQFLNNFVNLMVILML